MSKHRLFYSIAALTFCIDRLSKCVMTSLFTKTGTASVTISPFLNLSLAFNSGISFSLFAPAQGRAASVLTVTIAFVILSMVIIWKFFSSHTKLADSAYGLIIGGAIGNIYDRITYGGVIDFIDVHYGRWHWPLFNGADTAICIGFMLLLLESYREAAE